MRGNQREAEDIQQNIKSGAEKHLVETSCENRIEVTKWNFPVKRASWAE